MNADGRNVSSLTTTLTGKACRRVAGRDEDRLHHVGDQGTSSSDADPASNAAR